MDHVPTPYDSANPWKHINICPTSFELRSDTSIKRSVPICLAIVLEHVAVHCSKLQIEQRYILLLPELKLHRTGASMCIGMGWQ